MFSACFLTTFLLVYDSEPLKSKAPDVASTRGAGAAKDNEVDEQQDNSKPSKARAAMGFLTKVKGAPAPVPLSFVEVFVQ